MAHGRDAMLNGARRPPANPPTWYEISFWVAVVVASCCRNLYYAITSLSLFVTRLHWVLWPVSEYQVVPRSILAILLLWCYFLTPAHVFTFTLMDLWTPYSIHQPLNPIEIVYDPGDNAVVDVFAIHGLGSNPDSAWTYKENDTEIRWLKDILPKEANLAEIRVTMINHRTHWFANAADASFEDHAEMVLQGIESVHKANPERPIIFIAHSFGGLLLKQSLLLAKLKSSPVATMTRGILFLGVPHGGIQMTYIGSILSCTAYWRGSSTHLLEYMAPGSEPLSNLEKHFFEHFAHVHKSHAALPRIYDFQEMRPETFGRLSLGPSVDRSSGRASHGDVVRLDTDHRGLNKFKSSQDPNFRLFLRAFITAFEVATNGGTNDKTVSAGKEIKEFHLPFQLDVLRNDKFTGRGPLLVQVHESLNNQNAQNQTNIAILHGTGGMGKTEIAIEYAHMHRTSYSSIFWVDCSTESSLQQSFVRVANRLLTHYRSMAVDATTSKDIIARLGLTGLVDENGVVRITEKKTLKVVEAVKGWLEEAYNTGWLLIFDNLDDPENFDFWNYTPKALGGKLLVTSRRKDVTSYGYHIEITEMSQEEGLSFLAKMAGFRWPLYNEEEQLALKLVHLLECLPLAIEQAGAYISQRTFGADKNHHAALKNYLDSYDKNTKMLLKYRPHFSGKRNVTVWTTWEVSFSAIEKESPEAARLLLLSGFVDRDDIFEELFNLGHNLPPTDTTFQESVMKLSSYSMIRFRGKQDAFSVHPLIHYWVRERHNAKTQRQLARSVLELFVRALRLTREPHYPEISWRIIPHLHNVAVSMEKYLSSAPKEGCTLESQLPVELRTYSALYIIEAWYLWVWGWISDIKIICLRYMNLDMESWYENWRLAVELALAYRHLAVDWWLEMESASAYDDLARDWLDMDKDYTKCNRLSSKETCQYRKPWTASIDRTLLKWAFSEACADLHSEHPHTHAIALKLDWTLSIHKWNPVIRDCIDQSIREMGKFEEGRDGYPTIMIRPPSCYDLLTWPHLAAEMG